MRTFSESVFVILSAEVNALKLIVRLNATELFVESPRMLSYLVDAPTV